MLLYSLTMRPISSVAVHVSGLFIRVSDVLRNDCVMNRSGNVSHSDTKYDSTSRTIKITAKILRMLERMTVCTLSSRYTDWKNGTPRIPMRSPVCGDLMAE